MVQAPGQSIVQCLPICLYWAFVQCYDFLVLNSVLFPCLYSLDYLIIFVRKLPDLCLFPVFECYLHFGICLPASLIKCLYCTCIHLYSPTLLVFIYWLQSSSPWPINVPYYKRLKTVCVLYVLWSAFTQFQNLKTFLG